MPLMDRDKKTIARIAREYGVRRLWLFGSCLDAAVDEPNDIDLAVEGVAPDKFFEMGGKLLWELTRPVDLVDLSESDNYMISSIIRRTGRIIYERPERGGRATTRGGHTQRKTAHR